MNLETTVKNYYITVALFHADNTEALQGAKDPQARRNLVCNAKYDFDTAHKLAKELATWVDEPGAFCCVCSLDGIITYAYQYL